MLPSIGRDIPPLPEAIADFKVALERCRVAEEALRREMIGGGWITCHTDKD
ncbi:MAG: hypothetical protein KFB96_00515 [Thiocapsa sp.]|uniref:hypothetical protein n=1 Tax=Thiocapsa sp. TaxID=2024551 RepID=UPI001BCC576B|nr:hypothetical protein [Thiocapsa sp.]QVL49062.1 MAG: hypothetical protein KFB96_00515 [Thiocapsa sp.]